MKFHQNAFTIAIIGLVLFLGATRVSAQTTPVRLHSFGGTSLYNGLSPRGTLTDGGDGYVYGVTTSGGTANAGVVYRIEKNTGAYSVVLNIKAGADGAAPQCTLLLASDGLLYGTTLNNGVNNAGTIFRVGRDGNSYSNLFQFQKVNLPTEPRAPSAGLIQGPDGALYGTTSQGGAYSNGCVFKITTNGTGFTVLRHLGGTTADPRTPNNLLVLGSDGMLYGVTSSGGTNGAGVAFALSTDGSFYTNLYTFKTSGTEARNPVSLIQGIDGRLYGAGLNGGTNGAGAIFRMNTDGTGLTNVMSFKSISTEGRNPNGQITQGPDGVIYGTAANGGPAGVGSVFRVNADGSGYTNIYIFQAGGDGVSPSLGVMLTGDTLYGGTANGGSNNFGIVFRLGTNGAGYTVLAHFVGQAAGEPVNPGNPLLRGSDGYLYGATASGGQYALGAIYKVARDGSGYTNLYHFKGLTILGQTFNDGQNATGNLVEGADGGIYGTTSGGGSNNAGMIFRINKDGTGYRNIFSFRTSGTELRNPRTGLIQFTNGLLYGSCINGGLSNLGGIFRLDTNGNNLTVVHSFLGSVALDGTLPTGPLLNGGDGFLYGSCFTGGTNGFGTLFRMDADGNSYTNLYLFRGTPDGANPNYAPTKGVDGLLYFITQSGGSNSQGAFFRMARDGSGYTNLTTFRGTGNPEPRYPWGGIIQNVDGYFYGIANQGGTNGAGSVYRLATDGSYPVLIAGLRSGATGDGVGPSTALIQDPDGNTVYSLAGGSGEFGLGTIFSVALHVAPSVLVPPPVLWGECNVKSNLTFSASLNGTPPFSFQWYFNGTAIPAATNISFTVLSSTQANIGTYSLSFTNPYGQGSTTGSITGFRDSQAPTFNMFGANPLIVSAGSSFVDPGASCGDVCTGTITNFTTNVTVNPNVPGTYTIVYSAIDSSGNLGMATRAVWVTYHDSAVTTVGQFGGVYNPTGVDTYIMFQYGPTVSYGSNTAWVLYPAGGAVLPFTTSVSGLDRYVTYHYRQVTSNTLGVVTFGPDQSLLTNPLLRPGDTDGDNAVSLQELNQVLQRYRNLVP